MSEAVDRAVEAPVTLAARIPRVVRCVHCGDLAREQVRERLNDEEVAVRFSCPSCRWRQTRHYHDVIPLVTASNSDKK